MCVGFVIGVQQRCVKDVVDSPIGWEGQLIRYWGDLFSYSERA